MPLTTPSENAFDQEGHGQFHALTGARATQVIRDLAERQHGAVSRRQLLDAGLGRGLIEERVRSGRLLIVHRGVYAVGHRRNDRKHRWMAAVLACGPGAVLGRRSAAELWEMRRWHGPIEVIRTSGATCRDGIRAMQVGVEPSEVTTEQGIPVTTRERTLLDIATVLDTTQLQRAFAAAERAESLRWGELSRLLEAGRRRRGVGRLLQILSEADPSAVEARSGVEVDFLALCRRADLPLPSVNVLVAGYLVDFHWPKNRLVVELDSYHFHQGAHAFEHDHARTLALEAAGVSVKRVTDRMVIERPGEVVDQLRAALADRE